MSDIALSFEPGSGRYRLGNWARGSAADVVAKKQAAFRCIVLTMRQKGERLPPEEVAAIPPLTGGIVCRDWGTRPHWHAELLALPELSKQLIHVRRIKSVRMRGKFRQYQAIQYDERATDSWIQTWFCAPDVDAGLAVLDKMARGAGDGP